MKVLVTGANGFVGTHLVSHLSQNHVQVIGLDYQSPKSPSEILGKRCLYRLGSYRGLPEEIKEVDAIIHLASESHVDRSLSGPQEFIDNNVHGTLELFEFAKECKNLKTLIHFSTDEVGACLEEGSFFEKGQAFDCGSVYSASKGAQELLAQAYVKSFKLPIIITRCVNIFGSHQADEKFIPTVIRNALQNKSIPIYGNGMQMRQWVHVSHVCKFLNEILCLNIVPPKSVLHITGTKEIYNVLLARTILNFLGKKSDLIELVTDRLGHDLRYSLGQSEETNCYGFDAYGDHSFMSDLENTIRWYEKEKAWTQISG